MFDKIFDQNFDPKVCQTPTLFRNHDSFCQIIRILIKIEILVKSRNFGQQSKFWTKIEILVKNETLFLTKKFRFSRTFQFLVQNFDL